MLKEASLWNDLKKGMRG